MRAAQAYQDIGDNPLDLLEEVVSHNDWAFSRRTPTELSVEAPGRWCAYSLYFAWSERHGALHLSCAFDLPQADARWADSRKVEVCDLLARINRRLPFGHFALWPEEGVPLFRHAQFVRGGEAPIGLMRDMVDVALDECDRYYPAFQYVILGGMAAADALDASLLETVGQA